MTDQINVPSVVGAPAYVPRLITLDTITAPRVIAEPVSIETDDEIIDRLRSRFTILEDMAKAVKKGQVRAMIVSGPPGVGKSFGIESVLSKHDLFTSLDPSLKNYEICRGQMSPICLYQKLYEYRDKKMCLVLDDCDAVFGDEVSLNLLKSALDTGSKRHLNWNTESRILKEANIPNVFEFAGGIIFVTNIKFSQVKSAKLRGHLDALESRCHYLDLAIDTTRDKMLRIRQIVHDGMLDKFEFSIEEIDELVNFICDNKQTVRELSLRTLIKAAELKKSMPNSWQSVAKVTLLK